MEGSHCAGLGRNGGAPVSRANDGPLIHTICLLPSLVETRKRSEERRTWKRFTCESRPTQDADKAYYDQFRSSSNPVSINGK